ncbi:unnamed protein product [Heligmosomoides polygyrus]|uniref:Potassium channel domain-containing protein n=1 Tax=Heligmosomoides polygyrus TaxID=6339 RepID=A0A3P7TCS1_HELPZ|nr:unnamed protein product [Heligmosomoides polygyrus]
MVIASSPHVLLNLLLIVYLLFGTVVLQYMDKGIAKEDFPPALLFAFTTITTIGYGSIYPTTDLGKISCIVYCVVGIPLIFLVLSNNGQFLVDAYSIIRKSSGGKTAASEGLPIWLSVMLLCLHSLVGGLIFSTWLGQMRFFDAVYCSFISVSTIGYGDLVPVPDTLAHTVAIIAFLSAGVVILSTLFETFGCYLQYVHYIGRPFRGTKDVEVWFGGSMLTVQELITLVAEQFGSRVIVLENGDRRTVLVTRENTVEEDAEGMPLYQIPSNSSMQKLIVRDAGNALQALRVIHRMLSKTSHRAPPRARKLRNERRITV